MVDKPVQRRFLLSTVHLSPPGLWTYATCGTLPKLA